jgi:hypothetical protein
VLSCLGVWVLRQDADAERQRRRDTLDVSARRLALDIDHRLQEIEDRAARGDGVVFAPGGPVSTPTIPLLYQSMFFALDVSSAPGIAEAETAEHQKRDLSGAAAAYRELARSSAPAVRAAALVRLGRVLSKRGDLPGALQAYADLEKLGAISVEGQPAALVARLARCRALQKVGDTARLRTAALEFSRVLDAGGWRIDRPTFENYQEDLRG